MAWTNKCRCLCLGVIFIFGALSCQALQEDVMYQKFEQWMSDYERVYDNSAEKENRFRIFQGNVAYIESSNNKNKSYKLGVNQFADLTNEEFKATRTRVLEDPTRPKEVPSIRYGNVTSVPDSIDWRTKGAVTHVKDQGECQNCWAFVTVACTEGLTMIKTGELVALSEQELVDCVPSGHDNCRQPGTTKGGYEFIKSNGLSSEADYPYKGKQGTCSQDKSYAATITGHQYIPENDELELLNAVANQPVSAGVDASSLDFQHYTNDVFNGECGTQINHFVTIVGYGTTVDGTKYWIMKNSWGTKWGMEGYMLIPRDVSAPQGKCGLAKAASYPTSAGGKRPASPTSDRTTSGGRKWDPTFISFTFFITYFSKLLL